MMLRGRGPAHRPLPWGLERGPIAVVIVGGSLIAVALAGVTPWWVNVAWTLALATLIGVRVQGHSAAGWVQVWMSFRSGMADRARARVRAMTIREVTVAAGVCGVGETDTTLVAMIQLAPNLDLPTVIADAGTYTEDLVPVDELTGLLDHYGIAVDIDIVTTGQRVSRATSSYGMLYDQLVGSHPVVGNRLTWLVVRLDQERNLAALTSRGPCSVVAPKTLASAAYRIAGRLRERGVSAHPLPAQYLRDATRLLHAGVEPTGLAETWHRLTSPVAGRCVTSFGIDPERLDNRTIDDCWSWSADYTTMIINLTSMSSPGSDVTGPTMRAMVRYVGPPLHEPPLLQLHRLGGKQSEALLASLPGEPTLRDLGLPAVAALAAAGELSLPIGPTGQIIGAIAGQPSTALAMTLYDPARYNPQRRTIDVRADLPIVQQLVLRAAVVGADIEVHTTRPHRWRQLVTAMGDPGTLRLANDRSTATMPATIAVFDQLAPTATTAPTTITVGDPSGRLRSPANLSINQVGPASVSVSIPMHTVRVDLVEPVGETRYLDGSGHSAVSGPSAPPLVR